MPDGAPVAVLIITKPASPGSLVTMSSCSDVADVPLGPAAVNGPTIVRSFRVSVSEPTM